MKQLTKFLVAFLFLAFTNCQKEDTSSIETLQEQNIHDNSNFKLLKDNEVPSHITNYLLETTNNTLQFNLSGKKIEPITYNYGTQQRSNLEIGTVDTSKSQMVVNDNNIKYTFVMTNSDTSSFHNLVVVDMNGTIINYYIKYTPDAIWAQTHTMAKDMASYTGTITFYDKYGIPNGLFSFVDGTFDEDNSDDTLENPCDPVLPPDPDEDDGTTGGGGNGNGNGNGDSGSGYVIPDLGGSSGGGDDTSTCTITMGMECTGGGHHTSPDAPGCTVHDGWSITFNIPCGPQANRNGNIYGRENTEDPCGGDVGILIPDYLEFIEQIEECLGIDIGNITYNQADEMHNYLITQNQCSEQAQAFALAVIEAGPDAEVDWEEGIIFDNTWEDFPCHRSVVHGAIGVCSPLTGVVQSVFENNDFVYLLLTSEILPNNNAETVLNGFFTSTNTYYVKTRFNETYLNSATDLSIARTTIHESLHAIFVYMYEEGLLLSEDGSALEEYEDFVQAYINKLNELPYNFGTPGHEILAGFVDDIATSLSFYAQSVGHVNSFNYYRSLAWGGLTGTEQFNTLYPIEVNGEVNLERLKILNTIKAEALNENQYFEINGITHEITPKGITPNQTQPCN